MQGSCSSLKVKLIDQLTFCMLVFTACKELRTMYGKHNSSRHILEHSSVCFIEQAIVTTEVFLSRFWLKSSFSFSWLWFQLKVHSVLWNTLNSSSLSLSVMTTVMTQPSQRWQQSPFNLLCYDYKITSLSVVTTVIIRVFLSVLSVQLKVHTYCLDSGKVQKMS